MMKKLLFSVLAFCAFTAGNAQEISFGVKGGANFSNFDYSGSKGRTGFYAGVLADFAISETFHLQPEVLFSQEGAKDESISYIRVPFMSKYYLLEGVSLLAGPSFGYKIGAENDLLDNNTKSLDIAAAIGLAFDFPMGFFVDARYNVGATQISDSGIKNNNLQVGVGYRF